MSNTGLLENLMAVGVARQLSLAHMQQWAMQVGAALPPRSVVLLTGDLGAGKTTLARALAVGAGVFDANAVTSPTFSIVHQYKTRRGMIVHADLYRLKGDADLDAIGWEEIRENADVLIVEWPERVSGAWPAGTYHIQLHTNASDSESRQICVTAQP